MCHTEKTSISRMKKRSDVNGARFTMVRNTVKGEERIGCRASGVFKGFHIERTVWQPVDLVTPKTMDILKMMASNHYDEETRAIENFLIEKDGKTKQGYTES